MLQNNFSFEDESEADVKNVHASNQVGARFHQM